MVPARCALEASTYPPFLLFRWKRVRRNGLCKIALKSASALDRREMGRFAWLPNGQIEITVFRDLFFSNMAKQRAL